MAFLGAELYLTGPVTPSRFGVALLASVKEKDVSPNSTIRLLLPDVIANFLHPDQTALKESDQGSQCLLP